MPLTALPDFQQPVPDTDLRLYLSFGGTDQPCVLFPDGLQLAINTDGTPDFSLNLVREMDPNKPYAYGLLDFRLRPTYRSDDALAAIRRILPNGIVAPCTVDRGYLRFYLVASSTMMPDSLKTPVALGWNGLETGRWLQKLATDAASLLKQALGQKELLLRAWMEGEVTGVSSRLNVRVNFDASRLLGDLLKLGKDGVVPRDSVLGYFSANPSDLPLSLDRSLSGTDFQDFASAMTDRVRLNYAQFVPAPEMEKGICWTLKAASDVAAGVVDWDLSQAVEAPRGIALDFDPVSAVQQLIAAKGLDAVVHEVSVPPLDTGALAVSVSANVPAQRPGVMELGVSIDAPANPPYRMQPIQQSLVLTPPKDLAETVLHFSPLEPQSYSCTTFLVLMDSRGVRKLDGRPAAYDSSVVLLSPDQFPVNFVLVEAATTLLALAALHGTCTGMENGVQVASKFDMDGQHPAVAVAIPHEVQNVTLQIQAVTPQGQSLAIGPIPLASLHLDLFSFPQYGPKRVQMECAFDASTTTYAIELVPESTPGVQPSLAYFTSDKPTREWTYFAMSPFQPGFRYREYRNPGEAPAPWSDPQAPESTLHLQAAKAVAGGSR